MIQLLWINGRTPYQVFLLLLFLLFPVSSVRAGWVIESETPTVKHADTTVTLRYVSSDDGKNIASGRLWLFAPERDSVLLPETVEYLGTVAEIPLFIRKPDPVILVHDESRDETSTVTLKCRVLTGREKWIPTLGIAPAEDFPVVFANQEVTPTLTVTGGSGQIPPAAHIEATDHNGRLVLSRFFSTFELVGGLRSVRFPSIGNYLVRVRLLDDELTSLPHSSQREPIVIPFGEWVERPKLADLEAADFVTTDIVVGNVTAFEHVPTTATVLSEDRIVVPVFAVHSQESRLNRWPYMISDADIYSMPVLQQRNEGAKLLRWQRTLGATFGQIEVDWADIQTAPESFRWNKLIDLLPLYRSLQVRPVLTLGGRSAWNQKIPGDTTETLTAWYGFSRQLSEKFHKLIWGLQVEKYRGTGTSDAVTSYAKVLAATYTGFSTRDNQPIQAAPVLAEVDLADAPLLRQLLTSEAGEAIGGLSFNLYPRDPKASPDHSPMGAAIKHLKVELVEAGKADLPVWLMNTGWHNGPAGVTQELQANYLVRIHTLALANGFYKVGWDSLVDKSDLPWAEGKNTRMGLLTTQLRPKLSGVAYNNMTYLMSGVTPRAESRQGNARVFSFNIGLQSNKWPGILYVAWTEFPHKTQDVLLPMTQGGGVFALDYLGAEIPTENVEQDADNPIAGTYRIPVGFDPVFIWDAGKPGNKNTPPTEAEQE